MRAPPLPRSCNRFLSAPAGLFDRADEGLPRVFGDPRRREKAEQDAEQFLLIAELAHRGDVDKLGKSARSDKAPERP